MKGFVGADWLVSYAREEETAGQWGELVESTVL